LIETKTTDRSKKLLEVCSFKYNATGQIEEETCTRPEGFPLSQTHSYKYELDSQGSWTKRTGKTKSSFESKTTEQALPVKYRKIEYYASGDGNNSDATVLYAEKIKSLISSTAALAKPCSPLMIRKSRGVLEGSATRRVMPEYPAEAKRQRIGGPVLVEVTIDETGKVIDSRVISGPLELRDAAGAAAKRWTFQPTYLSKVPTKVIGVITFNFNL
jgi:TonB family protein